MHLPSAYELVATWEAGLRLTPVERGLRLLATLFPQASDDELADYSIGERDAWLLTLREQLFGSDVACVVTCPHCGEVLELNIQVSEVRAPTDQPGTAVVQVEDITICCRPPTSADLRVVASMPDLASARRALLHRCVLSIESTGPTGSPPTLDQLPPNVVSTVIEQMSQADQQADVQLALVCPACSNPWHAGFDILSFLWAELTDWVQRTLREVHVLATSYGWRETDILALSAWRRQWYLLLIGA